MTTMIAELYDALRDAGATEEKARSAAQSVAAYETRFAEVQQSITSLRGEMHQGFAALRGEMNHGFAGQRGDINLLRWMAGVNFALTVAVFIKLFVHSERRD